jgi:hypothetical protein
MAFESWLKIVLPAFPVAFTIFGVWFYWGENSLALLPPPLAFWGVVILFYVFTHIYVPDRRLPFVLTIFASVLWLVASITSHNLARFLVSTRYSGFISILSSKDFWYAYVNAIVGFGVYYYKISHSRAYAVGIVKEIPAPAGVALDKWGQLLLWQEDAMGDPLHNPSSRDIVARRQFSGHSELTQRERRALERYGMDETALDITRSEYRLVFKHTADRVRKVWRCDNCELVQMGRDDKCRRCGTPRPQASASEVFAGTERLFHTKTGEHRKSLIESRSDMLQDLEKRIRELELESIRKPTRREDEQLTRRQDWIQ